MQIKTMKYHLIPVRMAIIKSLQITNVGSDIGKKGILYTVNRNVKWHNHHGKQYGGS